MTIKIRTVPNVPMSKYYLFNYKLKKLFSYLNKKCRSYIWVKHFVLPILVQGPQSRSDLSTYLLTNTCTFTTNHLNNTELTTRNVKTKDEFIVKQWSKYTKRDRHNAIIYKRAVILCSSNLCKLTGFVDAPRKLGD